MWKFSGEITEDEEEEAAVNLPVVAAPPTEIYTLSGYTTPAYLFANSNILCCRTRTETDFDWNINTRKKTAVAGLEYHNFHDRTVSNDA